MRGWAGGKVELFVNTTNCPAGVDVPGLIQKAVEVWNNVPTSSIKVSYGGSTNSTTSSNPVTVYCALNFNAVTGGDEDGVPGSATSNSSTGSITAGLLVLNASGGQANIGNFDQTKLKIIVAHEIGHVLGLGHSASKNALMYFDASAKKKFALAQDDIDGMSYLYPSDETSGDDLMGCALVANTPPPQSGGWILLLLALLLPLAVRQKLVASQA